MGFNKSYMFNPSSLNKCKSDVAKRLLENTANIMEDVMWGAKLRLDGGNFQF